MEENVYKLCSSCKRGIPFDTKYWVCSVSTCNTKRMGLFFCSVRCWDAHLPEMRHREKWAVEKRSPTRAQHQAALAELADKEARQTAAATKDALPKRVAGASADDAEDLSDEILIVASRLKDYVTDHFALRTSDSVLVALSELVRGLISDAVDRAALNGRKTVMGRDLKKALLPPKGEVLIVISRLKKYVKVLSGMNTSNDVVEVLSDHVRIETNAAAKRALQAKRETLFARDYQDEP